MIGDRIGRDRGMTWRVAPLQARGRSIAGVFALSCVIGLAASPVGAQNEAAGPSWLRAPRTRGPVAATLAFDDQQARWAIDGALPLDFGLLSSRTPSVGRPALGLGLSITGASDAHDLRYTALLDRRGRRAGGWLGASSAGTQSRLYLGTGIWRSFAPIEVEAGIVSGTSGVTEQQASHWGFFSDSLHWRDTTTYSMVNRSVQRTTAQSTVRWHHGAFELSAIGGVTLGERSVPQRWAQANVQLQASRRVLVMAALGSRPDASLSFDQSIRTSMMLGVQVAPWASRDWAMARSIVPRVSEWAARPLGEGRTVIRVRCRNAARVDLAGDFTEWIPIALTPMGGDRWEATLPIDPGLHQVQIRIDGAAWQAPPELPTAEREFVGTVGLLVVE